MNTGLKKKILWAITSLVLIALAVIFTCDFLVSSNAKGRIYSKGDSVPAREYGLVLGTSPFWGDHRRNIYFENRISAASDLYKEGKVHRLIVSGGNYTTEGGYNEPVAMRDSLVAHGVPADSIILDYDGQRTIKSIANVRDKYKIDNIIIISQYYHNERALYQADHVGVDAIAYNAVTPRRLVKLIKNRGREYFARVKLFVDLATE